MVIRFLYPCRTFDGSVFHTDHIAVCKWKQRNDCCRSEVPFANGLSFFLFGFYTVYSSLFLALGKGIKGFLLGACRQGICFVPVILLLPKICGINGILYAQPIADVFSAVITIFMAWQLHRELRVTEEQISHDK